MVEMREWEIRPGREGGIPGEITRPWVVGEGVINCLFKEASKELKDW